MTLPVSSNTVCDVYRPGHAPPADPDVAGVPGHLSAVFRRGLSAGRLAEAELRFSHVLLTAVDADIRDAYDAGDLTGGPDTIYVPDGTAYRVVFVERRLRGTASDHRRIYLSREIPPT